MSTTARRVRVEGRVQGVFFRDSCRAEADARGVAGWVTNEPDGSVSVHLEGDEAAVAEVVAWCHEGPRHARVARVDESEAPLQGLTGFEVR
ncbi:MAG TPA: acylphosphatase [Marmoricola sp.]|nr:acylphosphatase [Marmoricola sp.]